MIAILAVSIVSSFIMFIALKIVGNKPSGRLTKNGNSTDDESGSYQDGAARRELEQRGFSLGWWRKRS